MNQLYLTPDNFEKQNYHKVKMHNKYKRSELLILLTLKQIYKKR